MSGYRVSRTEEDIRRELTDILRTLKDPRISGLLSIVRVELANDLSYCKVFVSSLEGIESTRESVKGLKSAAGYIRREIANRVQMRKSPEFKFIADDSIEHSAQIAKMLAELHKDEKPDEEKNG